MTIWAIFVVNAFGLTAGGIKLSGALPRTGAQLWFDAKENDGMRIAGEPLPAWGLDVKVDS